MTEIRTIADLKPDTRNANKGTDRGRGLVGQSLAKYGAGRSIVVDKDGRIIAGNKTVAEAKALDLPLRVVKTEGDELVVVQRVDMELNGDPNSRARKLAYADNRAGQLGLDWDLATLEDDLALGLDLGEVGFSVEDLAELGLGSQEPDELPDDIDEAPEPPANPITKPGDLWILGDHRLVCGDSTLATAINLLMQGERLDLLHADPPYGMGKEADGVANDNLYNEKLDAFQMDWWRAWRPSLLDNASAYMWGNPADLWRLWWLGLSREDGLTMRNEIVWDKGGGIGQRSGLQHSFSVSTERCLFFMLGQQFLGNVNKDDYWEGYEPLRLWLCEQLEIAGWTARTVNEITGTQMHGHWFGKSQFAIINRERYGELKRAATNGAFGFDYGELASRFLGSVDGGNKHKRDLSAALRESRSYFDNTHDNMNEVWRYPRVVGGERQGHATPKPVAMVQRAIKSSCRAGGNVGEPFIGSGSTLIAAEMSDVRLFGMELLPQWVDVTVQRWEQVTGGKATRSNP